MRGSPHARLNQLNKHGRRAHTDCDPRSPEFIPTTRVDTYAREPITSARSNLGRSVSSMSASLAVKIRVQEEIAQY